MRLTGHHTRGTGRRFKPKAEINVTPFVDVMLVLLVIFIATASGLVAQTGVDVDLPETDANALPAEQEQLTVSVTVEGEVFLQEEPITLEELVPRLEAIAENGYEERIFLKADKGADYGEVMVVMAHINQAGFSNLGLVTDQLEE